MNGRQRASDFFLRRRFNRRLPCSSRRAPGATATAAALQPVPLKGLFTGLQRGLLTGLMTSLLTLAGCANPSPPPLLYQLRSAVPQPVPVPAAAAATPTTPMHLQLMLPVTLPEVLDRDAIVVPSGSAGLQALAGHRWAEPLRDAVPRLLRQDLAALLPAGTVWAAPLPAGLAVQRQLRVEVLALQADAGRSQVQLQARWTLADPTGRAAPRAGVETLASPVQGADVDALVVAHRQVLWQLAQQLALQMQAVPLAAAR